MLLLGKQVECSLQWADKWGLSLRFQNVPPPPPEHTHKDQLSGGVQAI